MPATVTPDVTPLFTRERSAPVTTPPKRGVNPIVLTIAAVMLVLLAVGLVRNFLKPAKASNTVRIVGAAHDIAPGTRLGYNTLHYLEIPKDYVTPDMMTKSSEAAGRVTRLFVAAGEPVTNGVLFRGTSTLSSNVETHERALSVKLEEDALVDHHLYPGDYVDVIATASKEGKKYTKTVCQEVKVLMCLTREGLGSSQVRNEDRNRVTLAVTPQQGELIAEAIEIGKVRLALRNKLSRTNPKSVGVGEADLLPSKAFEVVAQRINIPVFTGLSAPNLPFLPPPPVPAMDRAFEAALPPVKSPIQWVVEIFNGSKRETRSFPENSVPASN